MNANTMTVAELNAINWWQTTSLDMALISSILGADHIAWVKSQTYPAAVCDSRAAGAWQANSSESYAAYRSLAANIRGGQ